MVELAKTLHQLNGEPIEGLSVYAGKEGWKPDPSKGPYTPDRLTPFPMTKQVNGLPMPRWEDLSQWMKVQIVPMALNHRFLTFNIRIHPILEERWAPVGVAKVDVRAKMVERIRKELTNALGAGREFFFVVEGWSKNTKLATHLHIHGGAELRALAECDKIKRAVARAAGHGLIGFPQIPSAVKTIPFVIEQAAYATYLLKAANKFDLRLTARRLAMSEGMTGTTRRFWEMITRNPEDWRDP